jgi:two-component system LytT family response regulator
MTLRAIIADDEAPARDRIRHLLQAHSDIAIVDECATGPQAVKSIRDLRPALAFLDIQMPGLDGFEVLHSLPVQERPGAIVFVTAHDEYALRAFDVSAVDYLLKPFAQERFHAALARARNTVAHGPQQQAVDNLLQNVQKERSPGGRFAVRIDDGIEVIRFADIDWAEADGNYVALHLRGRTVKVRETLGGLESKLNAAVFMRIHRSTIICLDRIARLEPWHHGEFVVILRDGTRLIASRTYAPALRASLLG